MKTDSTSNTCPAWQSLKHAAANGELDMRALFAADAARATKFSAEACGIYLDYSKNPIDADIRQLLLSLAQERGLQSKIEAMFNGEAINNSENRAVLHVALRAAADAPSLSIGDQDVRADVAEVRQRCANFAQRVRRGAWLGYTG